MTTLTLPLPLRRRGSQVAAALIVGLGHVIGWARKRARFLPAAAGAAGASWAIGGIVGHVWGHGLTPWVTLLVASMFALRLDGQIKLGPRG